MALTGRLRGNRKRPEKIANPTQNVKSVKTRAGQTGRQRLFLSQKIRMTARPQPPWPSAR
jgi:hypothetical protein